MTIRKKYSKEYKLDAVSLVLEQGYILQYISMFYNSKRLYSYLDYMSPNDYEMQLLEFKKAA